MSHYYYCLIFDTFFPLLSGICGGTGVGTRGGTGVGNIRYLYVNTYTIFAVPTIPAKIKLVIIHTQV